MAKLKKLNLPAACGVGLCAALALTALLCIPGAVVIDRGALPLDLAPVWATAAAGLAVFAAALLLSKVRGRQALPAAGAVAGGYILLAAVLCALGGDKSGFGPWLWKLAIAVMSGALLGAVLSIRQNPHRKRRR